MKAIILAAGFGTRLKPWTDYHPKALVPVEGVPMLERVILSLIRQGIDEICINIHHFGEQIIEFLSDRKFGCHIIISDERDGILDTGGGVARAYKLMNTDAPVLVHNVDIISNADLRALFDYHLDSGNAATLLTSDRYSSRKLLFDKAMQLKGWHNSITNEYRPVQLELAEKDYKALAFSGVYIVNNEVIEEMARIIPKPAYPVMDYFLSTDRRKRVGGYCPESLELLDIGKPASLSQAPDILKKIRSN